MCHSTFHKRCEKRLKKRLRRTQVSIARNSIQFAFLFVLRSFVWLFVCSPALFASSEKSTLLINLSFDFVFNLKCTIATSGMSIGHHHHHHHQTHTNTMPIAIDAHDHAHWLIKQLVYIIVHLDHFMRPVVANCCLKSIYEPHLNLIQTKTNVSNAWGLTEQALIMSIFLRFY